MDIYTKIYLVTNCFGDPSKIYIGKTKNSRENAHKRTYGQNIEYSIIDEVNSLNRKNWEPLETFWIEYYKFLGFTLMNVRKKGGSGSEFCTEETKQKISKGNFGKIRSEEQKLNLRKPKPEGTGNKISASSKGISRNKGISRSKEFVEFITKFNTNSKRSEETKQKMRKPKPEGFGKLISKAQKGIPKPKSEDAKLKMRGTRREGTGNKISVAKMKPIIQYTLEGNPIKEWPSAKTASEELHIFSSGINFCINGVQNTAYGFKWKRK